MFHLVAAGDERQLAQPAKLRNDRFRTVRKTCPINYDSSIMDYSLD